MILTVAEVKTHLRIEDDDEDDYILTLIQQAQATAENYCRVQFDETVERCAFRSRAPLPP